jgi:CHAD domain-containing protein
LRDFGKKFSNLRDAHVRGLLLLELTHQSNNTAYLSVLKQLVELNKSVITQTEYAMLVEKNEFSNFKDSWMSNDQIEPYFVLNNPDPTAITETLTQSYLKSSLAFNRAVDSLDPNLLHEWRKRLKDVQYQLELIYGNIKPDMQKHYLNILDLCNLLGELNDWDMMNHWISNNLDKLRTDMGLHSLFAKELMKHQETLLNSAISVGHELYTFTPERFKEKLI